MKEVAFGIIAAAVGAAGAAHADDEPIYHNTPRSAFLRDRNISVLERPRPQYASAGVHMGSFTALPRVTASVGYDDNILGTSSHTVGDTLSEVKPELRIVSDWSRNELDGFVHASVNSFARHHREDTVDYATGVNGRWDVMGLSYLYGDTRYGLFTIPRTSGSSPAAAKHREQYYSSQSNLGAVEELNRVRFSQTGSVETYRYLDVKALPGAPITGDCPTRTSVICNYSENHETYTGKAKAEYALTPAIALFGTASANTRRYDYSATDVGIDRNSTGWELTGGASFDISHLTRGEFQLGYLDQTYRNHQPVGGPRHFPSVKGLAMHGKVDWFPSQRTTVSLTADRAIQDWTVPLSSGTLSTQGGVRVDHELYRNVILSAQGGYNQLQYQGIDRTDDVWNAGAGVNYLLNRGVGVALNYTHLDQQSRGAALVRGSTFSDNRLMASLTLQY
jgi:hypothetical protein